MADFDQMTPALETKLARIELTLDEPVHFETADKKEHQAANRRNDVSPHRRRQRGSAACASLLHDTSLLMLHFAVSEL